MTEDLAHSSAIARHPSASLYDRVHALSLPSVSVVAAHKNVALVEGEPESILHYALKKTSRKTLKQIARGSEQACVALGLAISHALDVIAIKRLIMISDSLCQNPPRTEDALTTAAEEGLRKRFANDHVLTCIIWRDPVEEFTDYIRATIAEQDNPALKLPHDSASRVSVSGLAFSRQSHGTRA